jgi:hypothetical protein
MAKSNDAGCGCLMSAAVLAFLIIGAKFSFGIAFGVAAMLAGAAIYVKSSGDKARRAQLTQRFGPEIADAILRKQYWQGATYEMMLEAHGAPVDVRQKVLKSKTRETHCYNQTAKNRYALRLHYEDGVVVGWDA